MPADTTSREAGATTPKWRPRALLSALGPGLIAGASDIDPTTVATLAVVGASTVYGLAWLVVPAVPVRVVSAARGRRRSRCVP